MEIVDAKRPNKAKIVNEQRKQQNTFQPKGYQNQSKNVFKERVNMQWESFEFISNYIRSFIDKTSTKMLPSPIKSDRQLA